MSWIWIPVAACGGFLLGALAVMLWAVVTSPSPEGITKAFTASIRFPTE